MLLPLLMTLGVAGAVDNAVVAPRHGGPDSFLDLARDLTSADKGDRQLAARALRRRARVLLRESERKEGTLTQLEAVATLADYDAKVAPRCLKVLDQPDLIRPCADILGLLETAEARAPLAQALASEPRRGVQRAIERALRRIDAAHPPGESP